MSLDDKISKKGVDLILNYLAPACVEMLETKDSDCRILHFLGNRAEGRDVYQAIDSSLGGENRIYCWIGDWRLTVKDAIERQRREYPLRYGNEESNDPLVISLVMPPKGYAPTFYDYAQEIKQGTSTPIDLKKTRALEG